MANRKWNSAPNLIIQNALDQSPDNPEFLRVPDSLDRPDPLDLQGLAVRIGRLAWKQREDEEALVMHPGIRLTISNSSPRPRSSDGRMQRLRSIGTSSVVSSRLCSMGIAGFSVPCLAA
jgi:hypothetical protein